MGLGHKPTLTDSRRLRPRRQKERLLSLGSLKKNHFILASDYSVRVGVGAGLSMALVRMI